MKSKLKKTGKRKESRLVKFSMLFSTGLTVLSASIFIPLIAIDAGVNKDLVEEIRQTEAKIDFLIKDHQFPLILED